MQLYHVDDTVHRKGMMTRLAGEQQIIFLRVLCLYAVGVETAAREVTDGELSFQTLRGIDRFVVPSLSKF